MGCNVKEGNLLDKSPFDTKEMLKLVVIMKFILLKIQFLSFTEFRQFQQFR